MLSLLLLTTLVWGGCISCERYFTIGKSHACCTPDGHCKRNTPGQKGGSASECKLIVFDKHPGLDFHFDLAVEPADPLVFSVPAMQTVPERRAAVPPTASPPDMQVLISVFLI